MLRSQHAEATRRAVLAAARASFGKKGYAQTSVNEIAAEARVTKGAVYHHFAGLALAISITALCHQLTRGFGTDSRPAATHDMRKALRQAEMSRMGRKGSDLRWQ
jgi:AcrR family transcriptional regulator